MPYQKTTCMFKDGPRNGKELVIRHGGGLPKIKILQDWDARKNGWKKHVYQRDADTSTYQFIGTEEPE